MTTLLRHLWLIVLSGCIAVVPMVTMVLLLSGFGSSAEDTRAACARVWPYMWAAAAYFMGYGEGRHQAIIESIRQSWSK